MTLKNQRTKVILSICIFVVVFAALLVAATYTDLGVSKILTKNALPEGEYLSHDAFGVALEIFGSSPIYLLIAFCVGILFWHFNRVIKLKSLKYFLVVLFFVGGVAACWFFFKDIINYTLEHAGDEELGGTAAVMIAEILSSVVMNILIVFTLKNIKQETIKKLLIFVIAALAMAILANVIVQLVKIPMGRMRFRAMNSIGDTEYEGFTAWFVANGHRTPTDAQIAAGFAPDAFKSFPSGHTCAAGMTYALIMLPDVVKMNKHARRACWVCPIIFTGLVAISRIVVGAHYFSDVLFGGTISFVSMMLMREIFVFKGGHFKALKKGGAVEIIEA